MVPCLDRGRVKTSEKKPERAGNRERGAEEVVHLSDWLSRMTDRIGRPIRLQTFSLGRMRVIWIFSL